MTIADQSATPPARRTRGSDLAWALSRLLLFILTIALFVPWNGSFVAGLLDSSWDLALNWAFQKGVDFGHDFVFTFGPWGFIYQGFFPETFAWTVACWSFISIAFFAGLYQLARHLTRRRWIIFLCMLLAIALAGSTVPLLQDVRMNASSWLLMLLCFYVTDRKLIGTKILLAIAMALTSLVKFSIAFMAIAAIITVSLESIRRRRIPWVAGVFIAAYIVLWLAAGQHLSSLPVYFLNSCQISAGYSQAMSDAMANERIAVPLFIAGITLFLAAVLQAHRKLLAGIFPLAGASIAAFMAFKAGYVRHDMHEAVGSTSLMMLSLFYSAALWNSLPDARSRSILITTILFSMGLTWYSYAYRYQRGLIGDLGKTFAAAPDNLKSAALWAHGDPQLQQHYEHDLQEYRDTPIPEVHGTADFYPWGAAVFFAKGIQYQPRPVNQSYQAYTQKLAQLDADFLASPKAPDTILLGVATIDRRFPTLDDGASWPNLLTRYDLVTIFKSLVSLSRSEHPRSYTLVPLQTQTARLGDWISVPDSPDPIWANINLSLSPLGKAMEVAYRVPRAVITIQYADGRPAMMYRLIPDLAQGGFLISPVIYDANSFAQLYSKQWKPRLVHSLVSAINIGIADDLKGGVYYKPTFTVTFSALRYPHPDN